MLAEAIRASSSQELTRTDSPIAAAVVGELAASAVRSGRAQLLSLERIKARLGQGWEARRATLYARIERHAPQHIGADDLLLRVNETDYLLAFATGAPGRGRGAAVALLRDVAEFLFGAVEPTDIVVRTVDGVEGGVMTCRTLSEEEVAAAGEGRKAYAPPPPPAGAWPALRLPAALSRQPLLTLGAEALAMEHGLVPLLDLRRRAVLGQGVAGRLVTVGAGEIVSDEALARLPGAVGEALDLASLAVAHDLFLHVPEERRPLAVPLSLESLALTRSRLALLNRIEAFRAESRSALLIEIVGLRPGFMASRVREVAALIRPFCRAVFVRFPPVPGALVGMRGSDIRGAAFDAAELAREARRNPDPRLLTEAAALLGPSFMISGLRTPRAVEMARQIGATFGVLDAAYRD